MVIPMTATRVGRLFLLKTIMLNVYLKVLFPIIFFHGFSFYCLTISNTISTMSLGVFPGATFTCEVLTSSSRAGSHTTAWSEKVDEIHRLTLFYLQQIHKSLIPCMPRPQPLEQISGNQAMWMYRQVKCKLQCRTTKIFW